MTVDERQTWIRHAFYLALLTAFYHTLQFAAGILLYKRTDSPALLTYALDAIVSAPAALILALRIARHNRIDIIGIDERWRFRAVAFGYMACSLVGLYLGARDLWSGHPVGRNLLSVALAAVSMLAIPIIGSYMKVLAVELRSQALKNAAIFTFGNSYLSMVLLISQLVNIGMELRWGDPVGALVMFPFMMQKGIQILLDEGKNEYVEDEPKQ
jgi:divalent metal cation (Fe/Co/Zn/Cd) transporter